MKIARRAALSARTRCRPGGVRATNPLFGTENLRRIEPLLRTLRNVAEEVDAKPPQVALAWLIGLPGVVAIPGASSVARDALTNAARGFQPVSVARFAADTIREKLRRRSAPGATAPWEQSDEESETPCVTWVSRVTFLGCVSVIECMFDAWSQGTCSERSR